MTSFVRDAITFDSHLKTAVLLCACQLENHFFGSVFGVIFTETSVQPKTFGVV